jgi:metal-responsive CopG/Arc/MetJ family transcriptional regulator
MARIEIQVSEEIVDLLKNNFDKGKRSEFIRDAIQEKLIRKKIDDSDDINILKMIQKLDPELLKNKLTDNELMTQTLYEEIKSRMKF